MTTPQPCPEAGVWRPADGGRLKVRMPYSFTNRNWFEGLGVRPEWDRDGKRWLVSRPHFRKVVNALAEKFGSVCVYVDSSAKTRCDKRCREAAGDECECSCLGVNHQGAAYWQSWEEVGGTTLVGTDGVNRRHFHAFAKPKTVVTRPKRPATDTYVGPMGPSVGREAPPDKVYFCDTPYYKLPF